MQQASKYVSQDGKLNATAILQHETLYKGMNGREVERFYAPDGSSYIFKPLTNLNQFGREKWMYETILPDLSVHTPRLLAASVESEPDQSWLILEDLGTISHVYQETILLKMASYCANWHYTKIKEPFRLSSQGPKPFIEHMKKELGSQKEEVLKWGGVNSRLTQAIEGNLEQLLDFQFDVEPVFSHGDLHLGNFGLAKGRVVVFDWEYAHFNLPYWDLYHLIDLSHPDFPKRVTSEMRERVLRVYMEEVLAHDRELDTRQFLKEYVVFSAIFSIWMLRLIEKDLAAKTQKWSKSQLIEQKEEILSSFIQCVESFNQLKKSPSL